MEESHMHNQSDDTAIKIINLVKKYHISSKGLKKEFMRYIKSLLGKGRVVPALNGVNLEVKKGEIFGLLGPNGAGKTTLLKILSTLVLPDSGDAIVNGMSVTKHPGQVLRNLQAIFAENRGFPWRLTARQNLEFYADLYEIKASDVKQRVDSVLQFVGLHDRADDPIQRFSTGMFKKLFICKVLLSDASIYLFDEPTIGLDPIASLEFRDLLKYKLSHEQGKTIVLSTHNLWEAQSVCDRVAILHRGKIIAIGSPKEIRQMVDEFSILTVTFTQTLQTGSGKEITEELLTFNGVKHIDVENDRLKLSFQSGTDLNHILILISKFNLSIKSIETTNPTLEEAFSTLTSGE
jgi:ABC-2 type transport system ATP-binding protein